MKVSYHAFERRRKTGFGIEHSNTVFDQNYDSQLSVTIHFLLYYKYESSPSILEKKKPGLHLCSPLFPRWTKLDTPHYKFPIPAQENDITSNAQFLENGIFGEPFADTKPAREQRCHVSAKSTLSNKPCLQSRWHTSRLALCRAFRSGEKQSWATLKHVLNIQILFTNKSDLAMLAHCKLISQMDEKSEVKKMECFITKQNAH